MVRTISWLRSIDWPAIVGSALVVAFLALVVVPAIRLSETSYYEADQQTQDNSDAKDNKCEPRKTFWQRTTCDPVAFFTFWPAIFSTLLTVVSFIQIRFLTSANKTARLSADAAVESVKAMREIERAFIWGGGPIRPLHTKQFKMGVNNYGKTPGLLRKFAVSACERNNIPETPPPKYDFESPFHDWIRPDPTENRWLGYTHDLTKFKDPFIFGRFWYTDAWGSSFSIGFVLVIDHSTGDTTGIIPREIMETLSPAYTQLQKEDHGSSYHHTGEPPTTA